MSDHENARSEERRQRAWAVVCIALGMTQVKGATATAYLFAATGVSFQAIGGLTPACATACLTGAIQFVEDFTGETESMPDGFNDPALTRPNIDLVLAG